MKCSECGLLTDQTVTVRVTVAGHESVVDVAMCAGCLARWS